ncbi:thioredoxin family protein [Orenia marismortui]|uniref:thioredoxin family protein n=1 Tax=Orenia marismortui TaxID=46469 RepID=UPI00036E4CF9|nr:thioredoxin family protein [Orenia marismortui]
MEFTKVTSESFEQKVLGAEVPVLLEFSYKYCSACQEVKEFLKDNIDIEEIKLLEIDISTNQKMAEKYNVDKTPTLLLFSHGKERGRHIGYLDQDELEELLSQLSIISRIKEIIMELF